MLWHVRRSVMPLGTKPLSTPFGQSPCSYCTVLLVGQGHMSKCTRRALIQLISWIWHLAIPLLRQRGAVVSRGGRRCELYDGVCPASSRALSTATADLRSTSQDELRPFYHTPSQRFSTLRTCQSLIWHVANAWSRHDSGAPAVLTLRCRPPWRHCVLLLSSPPALHGSGAMP